MTMFKAIKFLVDNMEQIRADGPLHRQMTALAEQYLYTTLAFKIAQRDKI